MTIRSTPRVTSAAVQLRGVRKTFGTGAHAVPALDGIDLDVRPGEFVCLLGASGCGKSTLLNIVAGLDRPTSGSVVVPPGGAGLMFQEPALFPWLTARQNVELALRLRGVARSERSAEADRLLARVRLEDQATKRPHELSGGMRQRVALARALAQERSLLLMDEPFAALDAITRDVLHDELSELQQSSQLTVLFVTHNVREAVRLGDRVVLLTSRPGRVAQEYVIDIPQPRRIESPEVAARALAITDDLREEIRSHAS